MKGEVFCSANLHYSTYRKQTVWQIYLSNLGGMTNLAA
jgi:hypothetical protein